MADIKNTIETEVKINTTSAQIQIAKFNSVASDSTEELTDRIEAKNKAVKLQDQLQKANIEALKKEKKSLEGVVGQEKKLAAVTKKLNASRVKSVKETLKNAKAQKKLSVQLEDSKDSFKNLDDATGGLIGKFSALAKNPIMIAMAALAGIFTLLKGAVARSGKASETFSKIGAKLSGMLNGLMAVLEPVVVFIGEKLLKALNDPMGAIEDLGDSIKENLINRLEAFMVFGEAFSLLMEGKFSAAALKAKDAVLQLATGVKDLEGKMRKMAENAKIAFDEAAKATEALANKERRLLANRQALEKQQLKSLNLAEKERQIRDDISKSIDERIEANKRLGILLEEQSGIEMALAQQALGIANDELKATGQTIENLTAKGDAELKLLEIQERITGQRAEQIVNEQGLLLEKAEFEKLMRLDAIRADEAHIAARKLMGENVHDEEIELLKRKRDVELETLRLTQEGKDAINAEFDLARDEKEKEKTDKIEEKRLADEESDIELFELKMESDFERGERVLEQELMLLEMKRIQDVTAKDLTEKQIEVINKAAAAAKAKVTKASLIADKKEKELVIDNAMNGAAEVFGIAQEVAVAKMIMKAPEAVANSFAMASATYAPPMSMVMGALGAATTIVPIVKGLADIKKARFGKGSKKGGGGGQSISAGTGGGGGISSSAVGDIAANNASRMGIDPSMINGAENSAANRIAGGASANVILSESTASDFQRQVEVREERTTLG